MLSFALLVILAYLAGSVPAAWIAGRLTKTNLSTKGSGNLGATNTFRILGFAPAAAVALLDAAKGLFAVVVLPSVVIPHPVAFDIQIAKVLAGLACMLGHIFPIWFGFKGGKGVATGAAIALALAPVASLISLLVFLVVSLSTRYISLASLCAALVLPASYASLYRNDEFSLPVLIFCVLAAIIIAISHRKNIGRLCSGQEPRLGKGSDRGGK